MNIKLVRLEFNDTETLGVLLLNGRLFCYTLELPWKNNEKEVSCIPEGEYLVECKTSAHFGYVPFVLNVPDRSDIRIHVGNTAKDSTGCILVGKEPGFLNNKRAVLISRPVIDMLSALISGKSTLTITSLKELGNEERGICSPVCDSGDFGR